MPCDQEEIKFIKGSRAVNAIPMKKNHIRFIGDFLNRLSKTNMRKIAATRDIPMYRVSIAAAVSNPRNNQAAGLVCLASLNLVTQSNDANVNAIYKASSLADIPYIRVEINTEKRTPTIKEGILGIHSLARLKSRTADITNEP